MGNRMGRNRQQEALPPLPPPTPAQLKPVVYTDDATGKTHTFAVHENVILAGKAAEWAKKQGFEPVAKIAEIVGAVDQPTVALAFYKEGIPDGEGRIGALVGVKRNIPITGNIRPFPWVFKDLKPEEIVSASGEATCNSDAKEAPWGCASCDQSGKKFDPTTYQDEKEKIVAEITRVDPTQGAVRSTTLSCPANVFRSGEPVQGADSACKQVTIVTITEGSGTNRYSIILKPTLESVQRGILAAYGLPTTQTYMQSVLWSEMPMYNDAVKQMQDNQSVACDIDMLYLHTKLEEMFRRGYQPLQ